MILLNLSFLAVLTTAYNFKDCAQKPLSLAHVQKIGEKFYSTSPDFFFQKGLEYSPWHAFTDVFLKINLTDTDSYSFYQGANCTIVQQLYENDNRYLGFLKKAALFRSHQLSPFNDTIVGVSTSEPYEIQILVWKVNYIRVAVFVGAIILFLLASSLVRNVVFYYTSGCSFGLLASLLLVAFLVWRVAPKKTMGIPILVGGWSVSLYMLHFAWYNLQSIMFAYQKYVIGYFATVLLISLAVCYKRGPPTDARSHDIAQWTLQLLALVLIYFSSQVQEISIGTIVLLVVQQVTRGFLFSGILWYFAGLAAFWRKMFPKPRKLLSEEEYREEAERTTREQLALLKEYCRQEGSRPWKLAGKVRSARRLARFVEGEDGHVTEDEIFAHDVTSDRLDREDDFDGDDGDFSDENRYYGREDRRTTPFARYQDQNDEWDEIVVRRRGSGSRGRDGSSSVHSVRVPRSVSSRLLDPYRSMNHTFNVARDEEEEYEDDGRYRRREYAPRNVVPRYEASSSSRRAPILEARTDVRPTMRPSESNRQPMRIEVDRWRRELKSRRDQSLEDDERESNFNEPVFTSRQSTSSTATSSKSSSSKTMKTPSISKHSRIHDGELESDYEDDEPVY